MPFSYLRYMHELQGGNYPLEQPNMDPPTLAPLRKPIADSTIGIFTSCGARLSDQEPLGEVNDLTFRFVPRDVPADDVRFVVDHMTPVRKWALDDLNVAYPRDRLVELEAEGAFKRLADKAISMVGTITRYEELLDQTVPALKEAFDSLGVDLVLFFPF